MSFIKWDEDHSNGKLTVSGSLPSGKSFRASGRKRQDWNGSLEEAMRSSVAANLLKGIWPVCFTNERETVKVILVPNAETDALVEWLKNRGETVQSVERGVIESWREECDVDEIRLDSSADLKAIRSALSE